MSTIPQLASTLQSVFDAEIDALGRRTGLVQRVRKFTAGLLLKVLVFTPLKSPGAKTKDYLTTASQLGLTVTERAVAKRFTPRLVASLRLVLARVLEQAVAALPAETALLKKFTAVFIGDSTAVVLPDDCQDESPGCGGKSNSGRAALKLQVVWNLCTGKLVRLLIEPGRRSDTTSAAVAAIPPPGRCRCGTWVTSRSSGSRRGRPRGRTGSRGGNRVPRSSTRTGGRGISGNGCGGLVGTARSISGSCSGPRSASPAG
jgi:hypothetical protein